MSAPADTRAPSAEVVTRLRRLASARRSGAGPAAGPRSSETERCDLCGSTVPDDHRHLLQVVERRILCACEPCWAMRAGDPELRPTGTRTSALGGFRLDDELWARFRIPIGLAIFFHSEPAQRIVALYPSVAGATECELDLDAWDLLVVANPVLAGLESDVEALIVNRLSSPPQHALVPIDRCYELIGMIKASWTGISGGSAVEDAVAAFFDAVRARSAT